MRPERSYPATLSARRLRALRARRKQRWTRVVGNTLTGLACSLALTAGLVYGQSAHAAGEPVYECTDLRGFPFIMGWGASGPPEGWTPAENDCIEVGVNPGPDNPGPTGEGTAPDPGTAVTVPSPAPPDVSSQAAVEVLPGVYVLAHEADQVREYLAVHAYLRALFLAEWGPVLDCIAATESATAGGYLAQNPTSSASGRYQFISVAGDFAVSLAGHSEYAGTPARLWPEWAQDAAAVALIEYQGGSVLPAWQWSGHCDSVVPR